MIFSGICSQNSAAGISQICRIRNGRYGMNFVVCPLRGYGEKQLEDFARYVFGVRYSVLKEVMDMLETEPDFATQ